MPKIIFFDVNETLLDLRILSTSFQERFGDNQSLTDWFQLLVHSSTVVSITGHYANFGELAGAALQVVAAKYNKTLNEQQAVALLTQVRTAPAHKDVVPALRQLREAGHTLVALSNSAEAMLNEQLKNAGIADEFERVLSVEGIKKFKPSIEVYHWAASQMMIKPSEATMVAAHDWDIHGALNAGLQGIYVDREGKAYNKLYLQPQTVVSDLTAVAEQLI